MPTVDWNKNVWDGNYDWTDGGDEWSITWGSVRAQWLTSIWPRVASFLPTGSLLEIAPGFGRWTQYLLPQCSSYLGVDLSSSCVSACEKRFANEPRATFAANDGMTLPMVADESIDFVFSFDSLVHVEADSISSYLGEIARILSPDGAAFIHHSNVGIYRRSGWWLDLAAKTARAIPVSKKAVLGSAEPPPWHHNRGRSMTAERFLTMTNEAGLVCPGQEVIAWSTPLLTDCISVVTRKGSRWDRPYTFSQDRSFPAAARSAKAAAHAFQI